MNQKKLLNEKNEQNDLEEEAKGNNEEKDSKEAYANERRTEDKVQMPLNNLFTKAQEKGSKGKNIMKEMTITLHITQSTLLGPISRKIRNQHKKWLRLYFLN